MDDDDEPDDPQPDDNVVHVSVAMDEAMEAILARAYEPETTETT